MDGWMDGGREGERVGAREGAWRGRAGEGGRGAALSRRVLTAPRLGDFESKLLNAA